MRFRLTGRPGLAGHGELDAALPFNIADQADVRGNNRNKLSLALDLTKPEGLDALARLRNSLVSC
jgi:crotonobetainyl-CoA:carnitine CoA-transferase CaiB-like acyl-CoA transferase